MTVSSLHSAPEVFRYFFLIPKTKVALKGHATGHTPPRQMGANLRNGSRDNIHIK